MIGKQLGPSADENYSAGIMEGKEIGFEEGLEEGWAEGYERGYEEGLSVGRKEGADKLGKLMDVMKEDSRVEDAFLAATDADFRKKMYVEYKIG